MEKNRRWKLSERVSRWTKVEVNEEEEDEEDTGSEEEEVRGEEGEEETEAGREGEEEEGGEKRVRRDETVDEEKREKVEEGAENEGEGKVEESKQVHIKEEREVTEEEMEEGNEEEKINKVVEEVKEADELEEGERLGDNAGERKVMEVDEEEEEEQGEEQEHDDAQVKEGEQVERGDDEKDGQQEEEKNQDSTGQNDETIKEEENFSESVESSDENSDWMGCEDENSILGALFSEERKEEEDVCAELMDEEETVTGSWTTHTEEFQDYQGKEEEEDTTDDEEAEDFLYEDVDCDDENVAKFYRKDDYPTEMFRILTEFRDSSLLTDLDLSAEDGASFHVHSPVVAAVSSLIRESLSRNDTETNGADEGRDNDKTSVGINRWSVSLGEEVDHLGLEAIVEFAYSGLVSRLNTDTMRQIKAAAQTLGVSRVMDLCTEEESAKAGAQKKETRISAAEQMTISLQSIRQLWRDRVGCDVTLEGIGESLHVHRVILAASSDYFRGMFTLGMRESHQPRVSLPFLLASELEALISCSYSGALPLSWTSVFEITSTTLQLQYQPALSLCLSFLQEEINPHSCLDVASFAEAYEMVQLLEVADDFVLRQFQKVACTLKFRDLPAKQLLRYLNSRSLCVSSELVVFKAVVAWIQAKPKIRLRLAKELMKTIHFPLMTFKEFKEVQSLKIWSDRNLVELYEAIFEDFCSNEISPQSQCRVYLPKESVVLIGGDQISEDLGSRSISRELWFGNSLRNHTGIKKAMEWRRLGEMPGVARFSHEVAVLKGQLYVFGGKKYYGISDTLNSVCRYDPHQNSWESLAEMLEKRCFFSAVVLDGKIYAIGGHCDPEYIDSVERYCPTANSWSFTCPLDLPLSGHAARVLQGQIFVSGGLNSDYRCLASMFLYHPETGSSYMATMTTPRAHHCMETLGERLYVAGGITTDENMSVVDQLLCEVYSPVTDTWTAFTALPVPHVGAGSAVLEGKFYVLGGYSQEDYSDTKLVHRYDPTTQRWENMGKMPGPNNDIRACLLCLPPQVRL